MALQDVHDQQTSLVLSSDAKPRLKWTAELDQRFVDAVKKLGGAEKSTPKSLLNVMGIHGLTLYHLKSHLQKYRQGRSQQSRNHHHNKQEDNEETQRSRLIDEIHDGAKEQINESLQVARALQMQMELQRKLHEQIEVQRHLQLRVEAQGKYLQSILKKAQEALSAYSACSYEVEQLSQLASMVDSGCTASSLSVLTDSDGSLSKDAKEKTLRHSRCSLESSLTSTDSSASKEEAQPKHEVDMDFKHGGNATGKKRKKDSVLLSLMEMNPTSNGKRSKEANHIEQNGDGQRSLEKIDLNCNSQNEFDSGYELIDLNLQWV